MTKGMWIMFILYIMSKRAISDLKGPNVCQEEQKYKVNVTKYVLRNVTVRGYKWCLQVPPRCSTYSVQQTNDTKFEEEYRFRPVTKCCDGFYELNEDTCVPNSCRLCQHGLCDEVGVCSCKSGYWGDKCDQECTEDNWNSNCGRECTNCTEGYCDISMGNCTVCPPKFIRCELICSQGHKYSGCLKHCGCDRMTVCDPITNKCKMYKTGNTTGQEKYEYLNNVLTKNKFDDDNTKRKEIHVVDSIPDSLQHAQNINLDYNTTISYDYSELKTTVIVTEKIEEKPYRETMPNDPMTTTTTNIPNSTFTEKNTNFKSKTSEIDKTNNDIFDSNEYTRFSNNKTNEKRTLLTTNHTSHNVVIDSHLFTTIISAGLFSVLIIISAAVFCVLHKLRVKKRKYIEAARSSIDNGKEDIKLKESTPSLTVTARSIFHTPLPDPPIFENPAFLTQFEDSQNKQTGILETHVICNVNMPKIMSHDQSKQEFCYDHPPSTGKYRAASVPEQQNSNCNKNNFDPIYDEIPCQKRVVPVTPPSSTYIQEQSILYMNTK